MLSRTRLTNQAGPQPIQVSEIAAYCSLQNIESQDEIDDLIYYIQELDIVWLKKTHAEIERAIAKAKQKAGAK